MVLNFWGPGDPNCSISGADTSEMPTSASHICKTGINRILLEINEGRVANWMNLLNQDDAVREENSRDAVCVLIRDGVMDRWKIEKTDKNRRDGRRKDVLRANERWRLSKHPYNTCALYFWIQSTPIFCWRVSLWTFYPSVQIPGNKWKSKLREENVVFWSRRIFLYVWEVINKSTWWKMEEEGWGTPVLMCHFPGGLRCSMIDPWRTPQKCLMVYTEAALETSFQNEQINSIKCLKHAHNVPMSGFLCDLPAVCRLPWL